jgi:hypothetical protein
VNSIRGKRVACVVLPLVAAGWSVSIHQASWPTGVGLTEHRSECHQEQLVPFGAQPTNGAPGTSGVEI